MNLFGVPTPDVQILSYQNYNHIYPHHCSVEQYKNWYFVPPDNTCNKFRRSKELNISYNYLLDGGPVHPLDIDISEDPRHVHGKIKSPREVGKGWDGDYRSEIRPIHPEEYSDLLNRLNVCDRFDKMLTP